MKRQIAIMISIATVSFLVGTMFSSNYFASGGQPSIWDVVHDLQAKVDNLNTTVTGQQADISSLTAQIIALQNQVNNLTDVVNKHLNPPLPLWVSPTGFSDPDSGWDSENSAFDDNENSYASTVIVPGGTWSTFLYLTTSQLTSDRIRVLNKYSNEVCYYDIDVYRDAVWVDVFEGYLPISWYEITFSEGTVTQMRIRVIRVGGSGILYLLRLSEADFGNP